VTDPFVNAARHMFDRSAAEMRACIDGAPVEALNWRPAGPDTNSIAVLAVHSMHSTRSWLSVAMGLPEPARDRDAEFVAEAEDVPGLLGFFDSMSDDCRRVLAPEDDMDWDAERSPSRRAGSAPEPPTAGWALMHSLEHLREHVAHMQLTRQLWDARE
jgi:hypothetical protein